MERPKLNYWIDVGLAITFLLAFITGIIKWPALNLHKILMNFQIISFIHDWAGLIMSILVFIHLILHWNWIKAMSKQIFCKKK